MFYNATSVQSNNIAKKLLQNKRLVFIGDSLTRYQYLNFVYFLYTNTWFSPYPRNEVEHEWESYGGWEGFFKGTSMRMGCFEICDCQRSLVNKGFEIRHYYDSINNISIHFFLWLPPKHSIRGFRNIPLSNEYYSDCILGNYSIKNTSEFSFNHIDIIIFLEKVIRPLHPDSVIINQGLWLHSKFRQKHNFPIFAQKLSEITLLPIWKTTTANKRFDFPLDTD
eukprot:gene3660-7289_t